MIAPQTGDVIWITKLDRNALSALALVTDAVVDDGIFEVFMWGTTEQDRAAIIDLYTQLAPLAVYVDAPDIDEWAPLTGEPPADFWAALAKYQLTTR